MKNRVGQTLYRFRAHIAVVGFILAYIFANPSRQSLLDGLIPILPGLALRIWAAGHLGRIGRTNQVEAQTLVTSGPYRYVRNPLYVANFLLVLGALTALGSAWWLGLAVLLFFVAEYRLVVKSEEAALAARFGEAYETYRRSVPAILPGLGRGRERFPGADPRRFDRQRASGELNTLAVLAAVYALALMRIRLGR